MVFTKLRNGEIPLMKFTHNTHNSCIHRIILLSKEDCFKMSTSQLAILLAISVLGSANQNHSACTQPWQYMDTHTNSCLCYSNPRTQGIVRCTQHGAKVLIGFCMTIDNAGATYVGSCPNNYPAINYENTTEAVYILLPQNVSELNH